MTSNKVKNAEQQNKHKNSYERCTYVERVLKSTNMYTKWCTDGMVINSDSETRFVAMVYSMQTEKEFNLVNQILSMLSLIEVNAKKKLKLCTRA